LRHRVVTIDEKIIDSPPGTEVTTRYRLLVGSRVTKWNLERQALTLEKVKLKVLGTRRQSKWE
jgi:hypothetical protein